jgi:hypothetical protein
MAIMGFGCTEEAGETQGASDPEFRGYVWGSVGIVYMFTERWAVLMEGRPEAVQQEMAALHFSAAVTAIGLTRWTDERRLAEIVDLTEKTTAALALDGTRSQREWSEYLERRAPAYEQALPSPRGLGWDARALTKADLRRIGAEFLGGVRSHPAAAGLSASEAAGSELTAGEHFRSRLDQLIQGLKGMPGYRLDPSRDTTS